MMIKTPTRRDFLTTAGCGFGAVALNAILGGDPGRAARASSPEAPFHHAPRAKSCIFLFMNGGPSSVDLFDPKPELDRRHNQPYPGEVDYLFPRQGPLMKSPFRFSRHGQCGAAVSQVLPHLAQHVDDIAFLRGCVTDSKNHGPASYMLNLGATRVGVPSIGSWVTYGLGRESRDLPEYVVMYDHRTAPEGGTNLWDAAFLPGQCNGVTFRPSEHPILYTKRPADLTRDAQRRQLELLRRMNSEHAQRHGDSGELNGRMQSYETAFKMQMTVPSVVDLASESAATRKLYGLEDPEARHFGTQMILARRLVERGVPFVQVYSGGFDNNWDDHSDLAEDHAKRCRETDQPIAALLADLKQRDLLDTTLVVWGGEFGRLPISQDGNGRDHNPYGFTMWMAGGGVRGGVSHGETDEFGYKAIEDAVHIHDLHATILHLMGFDHERLTFHHNGRDHRLTDVYGNVVHDILA